MATPVYVVGNNHRFQLSVTKDGAAWTPTNVYLILIDPSRNQASYPCTLASGVWYYDTANGELSVEGDWRRRWRCVEGAIDNETDFIEFTVLPASTRV